MNLLGEFHWVQKYRKIRRAIEFTFSNDFHRNFFNTRPFSCVAAQICQRCLKQTSPLFSSGYFPGKNNA